MPLTGLPAISAACCRWRYVAEPRCSLCAKPRILALLNFVSHRVVEAHEPVLVQALRPELAVEPKAGEADLSMYALSVGLPGRLKSSVTLRV